MAVYEVFNQNVEYTYKCSVCSKATVFTVLITVLSVTLPFLIAYRSYGFWLKFDTFREQPDVHFKHQYIVIAESNQLDNPIICSTFANLNAMLEDLSHCAVVKTREEDYNKDGKYDELNFQMEIQLKYIESIFSVKLLLIFDYKLPTFTSFQMESLGFIQYSSSLPGGRFDVVGDLSLVQKEAFANNRRSKLYFNKSVIDSESMDPESFSFENVFRQYSKRNVSTIIKNIYPLWSVGRAVDNPFHISITLHYPEETIIYRPPFWQVIKWAWMQYLSILVISLYLFYRIKVYVFGNFLIYSMKVIPWKKIS